MEEEVVATSKNDNYKLVEQRYSDDSIDYYIKSEFNRSSMPGVHFDKAPHTDEYALYLTVGLDSYNYDKACEFADYLIEAVDFMGEVKGIVSAEQSMNKCQ